MPPFEIHRAGRADRVLLSCEHASNRLPAPWDWPEEDRWLVDDHWAWDPGAAELCRELAEHMSTTAVLSRFSRLLADPNRPHDHHELFRTRADGREVALNREVAPEERQRRLEATYEPYHAALARETEASRAPLLFSVHTFTAEYEGQPRDIELGILYDREEALGLEFTEHLVDIGYDARPNEPYSGRGGLIFSIDQAATAHGRVALEIELRQDLATDPDYRTRIVPDLARWLTMAAERF